VPALISKRRAFQKPAFKEHGARRQPGDAHTVPSFCRSNTISQATYRRMKNAGKGPREMEVFGRVVITEQAEQDWRLERERETAEKRGAQARREADPGVDSEEEEEKGEETGEEEKPP
jgi:hypothetical protein